jgi:hypothetical protein
MRMKALRDYKEEKNCRRYDEALKLCRGYEDDSSVEAIMRRKTVEAMMKTK